jgi:CRP/FNR family transcriptional regulator, cyclic AMP receptor protein
MATSFASNRHAVALLDADPDLGAGLSSHEFEAARRYSMAGTVEVDGHSWDPTRISEAADAGWLGLFVLDGLLMRRVTVGKRAACELFGAGDLIRPWDSDGEYDPLPITLDWVVLRPARLAILDTAFALRIARWPSITSRLISKVAQRARYLALTQAVTHLPRTHARLLMLFWLLAERWGRVTRDGVQITLPLTHEVLSVLVGSHRPTVTIALQRLARAGLLTREGSDRWLLTARATELLAHPESLALIGEDEELAAQASGAG